MRFRIHKRLAAFVLVLAAFALAGPAGAQVIAPQSLGAALAIPYLTSGGDRVTLATVTNTDTFTPYRLHLTWISGTTWQGIDFDCPVTPRETTWFVFEPGPVPDTARVTFECSDPGVAVPDPDGTNNVWVRSLPGADGILFVSVAGAAQTWTVGHNVLMGDATVMDFAQGSAFSVPAVHIQAIAPNGDRNYLFDGAEYASFPNALATNYIAPDAHTTAELILFTLDGTVGGGPGVNARLTGFAFDDDENDTSGQIAFDCFTVADISATPNGFGANVTREFGGHAVGHLQLYPDIALRGDVHDLNPLLGDGNGARVTPVHGWIVQTTQRLGDLLDIGARSAGEASWARQLGQSDVALLPLGGDKAGLVGH